MIKTLLFEGAGWENSKQSRDVGNCRIRTRLKNNKDKVIYLEMAHGIKSGFVWHCFEWDCNEKSDLRKFEGQGFVWDKYSILNFVNHYLDCSFDNLEVDNTGNVSPHTTCLPLC